MAGTIVADTWQNGDGTQNYKCRAWVNFNGTGTVAIRASGNVSSITDNGVGDYTVNLTTAMTDAKYAASLSCVNIASSTEATCNINMRSTSISTINMLTTIVTEAISTNTDMEYVSVSIFR